MSILAGCIVAEQKILLSALVDINVMILWSDHRICFLDWAIILLSLVHNTGGQRNPLQLCQANPEPVEKKAILMIKEIKKP